LTDELSGEGKIEDGEKFFGGIEIPEKIP